MDTSFLASHVRLQRFGICDPFVEDDAPATGVLYLHVPAGHIAPVDSFAEELEATEGTIEHVAYLKRLWAWDAWAAARQPGYDPEQWIWGPPSVFADVRAAVAGVLTCKAESMEKLADMVEAAGGDRNAALTHIPAWRAYMEMYLAGGR